MPDNFECFRQDRVVGVKSKGGGVASCINLSWSKSNKKVFCYAASAIECVGVMCHPRSLQNCKSVTVFNLYIPPSSTRTDISKFYDSLIPVISSIIDDSFILLCGDFNSAPISPLLTLCLNTIVNFPTRFEPKIEVSRGDF